MIHGVVAAVGYGVDMARPHCSGHCLSSVKDEVFRPAAVAELREPLYNLFWFFPVWPLHGADVEIGGRLLPSSINRRSIPQPEDYLVQVPLSQPQYHGQDTLLALAGIKGQAQPQRLPLKLCLPEDYFPAPVYIINHLGSKEIDQGVHVLLHEPDPLVKAGLVVKEGPLGLFVNEGIQPGDFLPYRVPVVIAVYSVHAAAVEKGPQAEVNIPLQFLVVIYPINFLPDFGYVLHIAIRCVK